MDITLRHFTDEDAAVVNEAIERSREHLRPWMRFANEPPMTLEERRAWFALMREGGHEVFGGWSDGAFVGNCGLHPRVGPRASEIGYWVHVDHLRRGVATTMVRQLCEIVFSREGVDHLEIHHDRANPPSGLVAKAAGFTHVLDRPDPPWGPADSGIECVWSRAR